MRVLLVSEVSSHMPGGVPAETRALARGLIQRGHEVLLLADAPLPIDGLLHHRLDVGHAKQYPLQFRAAVDRFRPHLVHLVGMGSTGLLQLEPELRTLPWLFTCHSISPSEKKLNRLHRNDLVHYTARALRYAPNTLAWRWIFRSGRIACTVVHSKQVQDTALRYGAAAAAVELIPLGVDLPDTSHAPSTSTVATPRILTIGGITHSKGQHDALDAVGQLGRDFPTLHFDLLGEVRDPSYLAFLRERIVELGLADRVALHCNAPAALKSELLAAADLYLQPSHEEGFCLAFIEAAPVVPRLVGTNTGAIAAVCLDDPAAISVEPRQPAALAQAMLRLLRETLPADLMIQRRQRLEARFSWDLYLDRHEALYRRLARD